MALSRSDLLRLMEPLRTGDGVKSISVLAQRFLQEPFEAAARQGHAPMPVGRPSVRYADVGQSRAAGYGVCEGEA